MILSQSMSTKRILLDITFETLSYLLIEVSNDHFWGPILILKITWKGGSLSGIVGKMTVFNNSKSTEHH